MADQDSVTQQSAELAAHRATLAVYLSQLAMHGKAFAPPGVHTGIADERRAIARIKAALRDQRTTVDDAPGDSEADDQNDPLPAAYALLETMPLDTLPARSALSGPHRMPIPRPNPLFVGREAALLALAVALKGDTDQTLGPVAVISGLGGKGKTQLATEFAYRYGRFYAGGVFWLSFADAQAVPGEMAAAGAALGLPSFAALSFEDQVGRVRQAWNEPVPRLLIFDNCEDETLLDSWRPQSGGCHILITSRHANWEAERGIRELRLDVLARPESVALLCKLHSELRLADPDLATIAELVGDLPIALHIAGSFLKSNRYDFSPATYADELRNTNVVAHSSFQQEVATLTINRHALHVEQTFALSYDQLDAQQAVDALAQRLLGTAACFAPGEPLPPALLRAALGAETSAEAFNQALLRLIGLGLIEETIGAPPRMHRLLAAVVRNSIGGEAFDSAAEQALLDAATRLSAKGYPAELQPIQTHLRFATERALTRADQQAAALCTALGSHLLAISAYAEAHTYLEQALTIHRQLHGEQHAATAASANLLGEVLWRQGKFREGQAQVEAGLAIRRAVLGEQHRDTARSLNNLARLLHEQAAYAAARPFYEQALAIREQVLGPTHPDTAESLNDLAALLNAQGELNTARPLLDRALAIREQVLGPTHPDTAISLSNLGSMLQAQGDYTAAQPYYNRTLAIHEQVFGPKHPHTARSLINLGSLLQSQGDYTAARPFFDRALAIQEQVLGPEHPNTANTLSNLGSLLQAQGEYAAARPFFDRALAIHEQVLGPTHPDTAISLANLGSLLQAQGDYAAAETYYRRALAIARATLGLQHPDTAISLNNFATLLLARRDYVGAAQTLQVALAIAEKMLGKKHPDTMLYRFNLAMAEQRIPGGLRKLKPDVASAALKWGKRDARGRGR